MPLDTDPETDEAQFEVYRRLGGAGRIAVMFRLIDLARQTAAAGIRARHPEYDEEKVRLALARLWLGDDDLAREVWPEGDLIEP